MSMNFRGRLLAATVCAGALGAAMPASGETLADALALAYQNNPTLQAQRAAQRALDEAYVQARASWRPTLNFTGSWSYSETATPRVVAQALGSFDRNGDGIVDGTVSREGLWRAQTPQAFRLGKLKAAYGRWPAGEEPTDDASVMERAGGHVAMVPGDPMLMKLTFPEDFLLAEQLSAGRRIVRMGQGIDAHRFGPGDVVWLGGIRIQHDLGLVGHSDADCALHALTDAVLGAIADGDIGEHFPPSDPQWKGASSDRFLIHAVKRVAARGGRILNADLTLICERPKIRPHRDAMRQRIAELLGLPIDRVSVKATTTEGMGFTGREEGLMAQAVVAVETPL